MKWNVAKQGFINFLRLEKSLSLNSIIAYTADIDKLIEFIETKYGNISIRKVSFEHLRDFIQNLNDNKVSPRTQARTLSGVKAMFRYLMMEEVIDLDPTALLELPKIGRSLPEILTIEEVDKLINAIDLNKAEGERNIAILETLYSCGLRVSELINLKLTDLFFDQNFIKVSGKGEKDRLVPISNTCKIKINNYINGSRSSIAIKPTYKNILFLNRRGGKLSRVMIFTIVKNLAQIIDLNKTISPHTFRHSFATHLIAGGADLRAVQDMLGHESILTTEIYTHLDNNFLQETVRQFHPRS